MPKNVIERSVPGAGRMNPSELQGMSAQSSTALRGMDGYVQWVHSYVADDRLFCVYNAEDEEIIREHARRGGLLCDHIRQVSAVIDPVTGEQ